MKKLIVYFTLFSSFSVSAQVVVDSPEYQERKRNNTLNGLEIISNTPASTTLEFHKPTGNGNSFQEKTTGCDCYIAPDNTYILAMQPNDDGSSSIIDIPFNFCFYGQNYNQLYINNNGNITFENSLSVYSANAFPSVGDKIIAPFWGDVDTRGIGQVVYKITPTALYVNWENVGYFNSYTDKINTFQLIITDGTDPSIADGNIAFCYKDMQWTTGDASSGTNGFGGVPATAGANKSDGIGFFQIAQFDHAGSDFDGALGNADGISWLDNKSFYFNICNASNIPPIPEGISACDTFTLCALDDTADISIQFLSPEEDQLTNITFTSSSGLNVTTLSNTPGNSSQIVLRVIAEAGMEGYHTVTVTATDDFTPAGVTTLSFTIFIDPLNGADLDPIIDPQEACEIADLLVLNGPYDTYLWDNLAVTPTTTLDTAIVFGVTVSRNGCFKRYEHFIHVAEPIAFDFQGSMLLCDGAMTTSVFLGDSLEYSSITWNLGIPERDSMYINELSAGTYTISVVDSSNLCAKDTTFTINASSPVILEPDFLLCAQSYDFNTNIGGTGEGEWSFVNSAGIPDFLDSLDINTIVNLPDDGVYNLIFTDKYCPYDDTITITKATPPKFNFNSDFFNCQGQLTDLFVLDSLAMDSISWGLADLSRDTMYFNSLTAGTYNVHLEDTIRLCPSDTSFTIGSAVPVVLQPDLVQCDPDLQFTTNSGGSGTGTWVIVNAPLNPDFINLTDLNTTVSFYQNGVYEIAFVDVACNYSDTILITKSSPVPFAIQSDFFVCPGGLEDVFINDSVSKGSITWGLADEGLDTLYSASLPAGVYAPTIFDALGLCQNDTVFTIGTQPDLFLVADFTLCDTVFDFNNNIASSGNGLWSIVSTSPDPTFSSLSDVNASLTFHASGVYDLIYTDAVCPNIVDTIRVTVGAVPEFDLNTDGFYCPGTTEALAVGNPSNLQSIVWDPSLPQLNNDFTVNLTAGTYDATIVSVLGCSNDTTFTLATQPKIDIFDYNDTCATDLVMTQNGIAPAGSWVVISGPGTVTFGSQTSINTTMDVSAFGTYVVKFSESVCADADTLIIQFFGPPTINVDDAAICAGQPFEIVATSNVSSQSILWDNNDIGNTTIVTEKGTYYVTATNLCGTAEDSAFIDIRVCELAFPNIFTPNAADGVNSTFQVLQPSDAFSLFHCQIFNRWGEIIYEYDSVFGSWNGKNKHDVDASPGVYFYKITATSYVGESFEFQGNIQLVRD